MLYNSVDLAVPTCIIEGPPCGTHGSRPHLGLSDLTMTPDEGVDIQIEGTDKWLTLIQATAKSAD